MGGQGCTSDRYNRGRVIDWSSRCRHSKTIEALQTHLSTLGQRHVTCAYTHAAARFIGGSTIARLLHFDHRLHDAWILIDEVSLIPIDTLGQVARWKMIGAKIVMFGDYDGQFESFKDRWSQVSYANVPSSELIRNMCNGKHFHTQIYKRSTDQKQFDWFYSMYPRKDHADTALTALVTESQIRYPVRVTPMQVHTILCISHANREIVNRRQNEIFAAAQEARGAYTQHI